MPTPIVYEDGERGIVSIVCEVNLKNLLKNLFNGVLPEGCLNVTEALNQYYSTYPACMDVFDIAIVDDNFRCLSAHIVTLDESK